MNYFLHLGVMIAIYIMLAYSLNLVIGYGGLLALSQAAFYGIGAYAYTLVSMHLGLSFFPATLIAMFVCGVIGCLFAMAVLKFRNETFALATIGFQMIVFVILYNWTPFTKGPYGISGIARPTFFGLTIESVPQFFIFVVIIALLVTGIMKILYISPFALSLKALRDDEKAAQTLGISPYRQYVRAMIICSAIAAIPGACFASYVTYIDPTSFTLQESIFIASILLVGGSGNLKGPTAGVLLMLLLPEVLRFVGMPNAVAANMREIIYGLMLILLMYFRPKGIAGAYAFK
ncbi:MAG: branched-chain amino acid ABC transporter permease [Kiritimatiellae bacterium]|jgi:branched-chain amino acid transport system permease protein|nr:branched-chain amino acid ABC transporter permease [Kiritimatiellia bacterium]